LRRAARIAEGKIDFQMVRRAFLDLAVRPDEQPFYVVHKSVDFWWHSGRAGDLDERPAGKARLQLIVVEF